MSTNTPIAFVAFQGGHFPFTSMQDIHDTVTRWVGGISEAVIDGTTTRVRGPNGAAVILFL